MGSELKSITGLGLSKPNTYPNMERITYEPAKLRSIDVDIKIVACGICGADPHYARGDWGGPHLPIIPGHEIIGYIVNKGSDVSDDDFKIGDRVGVGAKADCCGSCYRCAHSFENNCRNSVFTYGNFVPMPYRQGGYASHIRLNSKFVVKIPDNISSEHAAPLLCGGMTGLSPLLSTGVGKGTRVAICGIGGIGHLSIMFAKALGAHVTAVSSSEKKKQLAVDLGADHFISQDDPEYAQKNVDAFDVIVHTGSFVTNKLIAEFLMMLRPNGNIQLIAGPDLEDKTLDLNVFNLIRNNAKIGGIASGSPKQIKDMFELASKNNITPLIETVQINENNLKESLNRLDRGDVKFRFVLIGYEEYFK